jgi:hypothetical protein
MLARVFREGLMYNCNFCCHSTELAYNLALPDWLASEKSFKRITMSFIYFMLNQDSVCLIRAGKVWELG